MFATLRKMLAELLEMLRAFVMGRSAQAALFLHAEDALGRDVSPADRAPDELGCAESVCMLIREIVPFPLITGTATLDEALARDIRFAEHSESAGPGTIIISPTGMGNGKIRGHVGIVGRDSKIMANESASGRWLYGYNLTTWLNYYGGVGGLPVYFYTLK